MIGLSISIDFYLRSKNSRFLTLGLAWFLWLCAGFFPLISLTIIDLAYADFLLIYNALLTTLALLILVKGLLAYFITVRLKIFLLIIFIIIILSHFLYFMIGSMMAITITSLISQIIWISGILVPYIRWKIFTKRVDKQLWYTYFIITIVGLVYIPISILIFIEGLGFGLYAADNVVLIFLNYGYLLIITVLLQILTVHLEYKISQAEKLEVKDVYSHNLGNALQAVYTSLDLLSNPNLNNNDKDEVKQTLQDKLKEAAELLKEIRGL